MMMKPILFNTEMVRAILDGRKTQTRRLINKDISNRFDIDTDGTAFAYINQATGDSYKPQDICRYKAGDILWVRETWLRGDDGYHYKANATNTSEELKKAYGYKWRPSIHMPRTAARIFLKVTDVRVGRLQEITEADAKAEGITSYWAEPHRDVPPFIGAAKGLGEDLCHARCEAFQQLWDSIYENWSDNPWVWVIEFERTEAPESWK